MYTRDVFGKVMSDLILLSCLEWMSEFVVLFCLGLGSHLVSSGFTFMLFHLFMSVVVVMVMSSYDDISMNAFV